MKQIIESFKTIISQYHNEVVVDVLTFKNLFHSLKSIPALMFGFYIALNLSELLVTVFIAFYFLDFFTGILATMVEIKKAPELFKERSTRKPKGYWVESDRIIRGIVKAVVYLQIIGLTLVITSVLKVQDYELHGLLIPLTPIQIVLVLCTSSEFVSNLENSKRAGFDIIGMLGNGAKNLWNLRSLIKTGKE